MKNCRLIWGILLMISFTSVFGQQDAQYTQYMYNMNVLNPAYAGSRGNLSIGLLGRTQWVGIEGAPKTITLSLNSPVGKNIGIGLSAIADTHGPVTEQNLYADFSYTIRTSDIGRLAFGLKAGASFLDVNLLSLNPNDPEYSSTLSNNVNEVYPNIGAGAYYYTDRFYLGLSVPNFIESDHSVSAMVGFQITSGIRAGYAYDYTLSNLGNYNSGSHEIILLFDILNNKLKSPRFF